LDLNHEEKLIASFGKESLSLLSFPLIYQGERIGKLQLAQRAPNESFSQVDVLLIENIVKQAGAAAQTVRLNSELARTRTQIVNEREEERLRIRRDLHDELGPLLACQSLKLFAVRQVLRGKPEKAEALVDELIKQSEQTVADIRRLVHGLRPPVLDQLGLAEAIRDSTYSNMDGLQVELAISPNTLPSLPAAVEVNAYRIVLEALNNITKHARAGHCRVELKVESENILMVKIEDNGVGIPPEYRAGVGLRSMRLRAEEIGGTLKIKSVQPHGARLTVQLPLRNQA
jgi:signal transduction histidine kinase